MSGPRERRYWVVKHGLDSLEALPNYVWNTGSIAEPRGFKSVAVGDWWIGFAHTTSDAREKSLSLVTGFNECVERSRFRDIPRHAQKLEGSAKRGWMIRGRPLGRQPCAPVGVPPIQDFITNRNLWHQTTLTSISRGEFNRIRGYVMRHQLNPDEIPLFDRQPRCEQEVLAIVACGHRNFGIQKILRIRTRFPDMLVKLVGKKEPVCLELELYSKSFLSHGHARQINRGCFVDSTNGKALRRPVALLCWVHNTSSARLKKDGRVERVYELQSLIRKRGKIRW